MTLGTKLMRIRRTLTMCGPSVTGRLVLHRFVPLGRIHPDRLAGVRAFDAEHDVETASDVPPADLGITGTSGEHAIEYSPTAVASFSFMMRRIGIDHSDFTFVDVGAGKGLVMLLASNFPFRQIVGVEASPQLCEVARRNVATYRSPQQRCADLVLCETDALKYQFPECDTLLYLCNPFGETVLRPFFDRLQVSLEHSPRRVLVVYDNPNEAADVLETHPVLDLVEWYETISDDYTWAWFEARF